MNNIKKIVKRTRIYQKKRCEVLNPNRDIKHSHIIYSCGNTKQDKLKQYKKLFTQWKITDYYHYGFIYFIDEKLAFINNNVTIDNSPLDYGMIIDYGLKQINTRYNNNVSSYNEKFLKEVSLFTQRIIRTINDDNKIIDKDKSFFISTFENINSRPAYSLREALQRILFWNQILVQTGHYLNGLGRLDVILEKLPVNEETPRLLENFFRVLHTHYKFRSRNLLGDIGQIIVLGGCDSRGARVENEYTHLIITILQKLHFSDPKIILRASDKISDDLLHKAIKCIETGIGSPLISNDSVVIKSLVDYGYDIEDARNYGVSACWETLSIGNSLEQNNLTNIEYAKVLNDAILDTRFTKCSNFKDVEELYFKHLHGHLKNIELFLDSIEFEEDPIYTLFSRSCLSNDKTIAEGGSKYNNYGILSVGMSSVVDALCNIRDYCFSNKKYSLDQIQKIIKNDAFDGDDYFFKNNKNHFGNDTSESEIITNEIIDKTSQFINGYKNKYGGKVKFGLSSPGYIDCGKTIGVTLDGRQSGKPFGTHISTSHGDSLTSLFNFAASLHYYGNRSNGNVVDYFTNLKQIEENENKFEFVIRVALQKGIFQCQFNVASYDELLDAKLHPEDHRNLIVRVWGFSAYFNDLPEEYKDVLILRAKDVG